MFKVCQLSNLECPAGNGRLQQVEPALYGITLWWPVRCHSYTYETLNAFTLILLIEAYSQYTKHHSDLLTLMSLNFLPYDFGRIWAYIF